MIDSKTLDAAHGKHYTEFSEIIKAELHTKLANHEVVKQYASEVDNIQSMKTVFNSINKSSGEE